MARRSSLGLPIFFKKPPFPLVRFLLVMVVFLTVFYFIIGANLMSSTLVEIASSIDCVPHENLRQVADIEKKSLLLFDHQKLEEKLSSQFKKLKVVKIETKWPNKAVIGGVCRQPVAQLARLADGQLTSDGSRFLIDEDGVIFDNLTAAAIALPLIVVGKPIVEDNSLPVEEARIALRLIKSFDQSGFVTTMVRVGENHLTFDLVGGMVVEIGLVDSQEKIDPLGKLLRKLKIDGLSPKKIDYRFKRPVLIY